MPTQHQQKTFGMKVKTVTGDTGADAGQFKALVSAFGNVDHVGDVVMPGAFTKSLAGWADRGDPIPVVWSHDWDDPFSHIGVVSKAYETDDGLEVEAQLDLDNPKALQVYRLMKGRRVSQLSFAYDVRAAVPGQRDGKAVNELTELDVMEVGPCLRGANPNTQVIEVKSDTFVELPDLTPARFTEWVNSITTITPAALGAWATERSPR